MLPKEVPLLLKVLCAICDALVGLRQGERLRCQLRNFEDLTLDRQRERAQKIDAGGNFLEHGAERQECAHCGAESGVFSLEG